MYCQGLLKPEGLLVAKIVIKNKIQADLRCPATSVEDTMVILYNSLRIKAGHVQVERENMA